MAYSLKKAKRKKQMIEVLNHIDDVKKIRELLLASKFKEAVKDLNQKSTY